MSFSRQNWNIDLLVVEESEKFVPYGQGTLSGY
jgi:hypothetical protein